MNRFKIIWCFRVGSNYYDSTSVLTMNVEFFEEKKKYPEAY